ncbi:MAG: hybrid sensor histidine kinase/response regulator [Coleofasciculus sp. C1-SOL-03]|jgi:signal transduction histidine kinase|uniref:hybrid sensor histidine kinase/response regulator n=1 Tax=Coleofasciculus sp. C1-SOL-03 TaxID=3069522 RepID=UPI0032F4EE14
MNNSIPKTPKLLIVDDQPHNLGILFDFLTRSGFKIFVALDGESALQRTEVTKPDLIILDVMMPGIDGFETCKRLKQNPSTQDIPIIFMTALSDTVDKVQGFKLGAVDYITKPIHQEEVLSRIQTHIKLYYLQNQLQTKTEELAHLNQNLEEIVQARTQQLIEQEKTALIGRLTQGIVHNLRNRIQLILSYKCLATGEMTEEAVSPETTFAYLEKMAEATWDMSQILDNLMHKSKMDHSLQLTSLNINDLLKKELEFWQANLQFKHKVKKKYVLDEHIPFIPLVYTDISQILDNLIGNALDAMWDKEEQTLTIITRQDEDNLYIDVQDTGCGIAPENLSKVFDPFYTTKPLKGEEKQRNQPTGTGLGIYTCMQILKGFGGDIKVTSELNKGSIFTVRIPKQSNG